MIKIDIYSDHINIFTKHLSDNIITRIEEVIKDYSTTYIEYGDFIRVEKPTFELLYDLSELEHIILF